MNPRNLKSGYGADTVRNAPTMPTGQLLLDGKTWVPQVARAATTLQRMRGLLGCRDLPAGQGLLIERCGSIHTVGMRFAIDVVFLDDAWQVCRVCREVRPGRLCVWGGWRARRCLEVAAGWLDVAGAVAGTFVTWREKPIITPHEV